MMSQPVDNTRFSDMLAITITVVISVWLMFGIRLAYPLTHKRRTNLREVIFGLLLGLVAFVAIAMIAVNTF